MNTSNRLAHEQSPYLLQHADNPVDWRAWGEEAFALARELDKPILLSIGYSTCHWCHVMAHETFEDKDAAEVLNRVFVNIKVDREERPDIDAIYMTVCQMMTGSGGWPLTLLLLPDKRPFFAATFLPKRSRMGRMGLVDLAERVEELWKTERDALLQSAGHVTQSLEQVLAPRDDVGQAMPLDAPEQAEKEFRERYDREHGGFGTAPKFPSPHNLLLLMRRFQRTRDPELRTIVEHALDAMRRGGLFDQLGGGFHRYSTDQEWLLPHFEKMLYDQAMLTMAYAEAWQLFGEARHRRVAEEVVEYVLRDLRSPEDAFFSAEDADSEGEEGRFYVFTLDEVREALTRAMGQDQGERETALAQRVYNLVAEGNFADETTGRRSGANILHLSQPLERTAQELNLPLDELATRLAAIRRVLFERRARRVRPGLDDKTLTDWNGLMIAALAKAGRAFGREDFVEAAARAADFLLRTMRPESGALYHRYRQGRAGLPPHLDDYAFLIWGLIELYEASFAPRWLEAAAELMEEQIERFGDTAGGFFRTPADGEELLVRHKEWMDGAAPSGNSVSLLNLLRLGRLLGRTAYEELAETMLRAVGWEVSRQPAAFSFLLCGFDFAQGPGREVVIVGPREQARPFLDALAGFYAPRTVTLFKEPGTADAETLDRLAPFTANFESVPARGRVQSRAEAYVCRDFACEYPVDDARAMLDLLAHNQRSA